MSGTTSVLKSHSLHKVPLHEPDRVKSSTLIFSSPASKELNRFNTFRESQILLLPTKPQKRIIISADTFGFQGYKYLGSLMRNQISLCTTKEGRSFPWITEDLLPCPYLKELLC